MTIISVPVATLNNRSIDLLVAEIAGITLERYNNRFYQPNQSCYDSWTTATYYNNAKEWNPTYDMNQGMAFIQEIGVSLHYDEPYWVATPRNRDGDVQTGKTFLVAALRSYIEFKRGPIVEVSDEFQA